MTKRKWEERNKSIKNIKWILFPLFVFVTFIFRFFCYTTLILTKTHKYFHYYEKFVYLIWKIYMFKIFVVLQIICGICLLSCRSRSFCNHFNKHSKEKTKWIYIFKIVLKEMCVVRACHDWWFQNISIWLLKNVLTSRILYKKEPTNCELPCTGFSHNSFILQPLLTYLNLTTAYRSVAENVVLYGIFT